MFGGAKRPAIAFRSQARPQIWPKIWPKVWPKARDGSADGPERRGTHRSPGERRDAERIE
jgi:hypothetical protein